MAISPIPPVPPDDAPSAPAEAPVASPAPFAPPSPFLPRRLFTVDEVMRMVEAGILAENDRVELLEGDLIQMTPQGPPHASLSGELHDQLRAAYGRDVCIRSAAPLSCGPHNLPEPDLAVVRGTHRDFVDRHPQGAEAVLVIEIAYSSRTRDLAKTAIYARACVPAYWLIDLPARQILIHEQPEPGASYARVSVVKPGDSISPPGSSAVWTADALLL